VEGGGIVPAVCTSLVEIPVMAETVACPGCQVKLKLKPEYAGKKIKCPRCAHLIVVPSVAGVTAGRPRPGAPAKLAPRGAPQKAVTPKVPAAAAKKARPPADDDDDAVIAGPPTKKKRKSDMAPCPECGEPVDVAATKCPHCKTPLEADEEEEYRKWKKCPTCGKQAAKRVLWTFWGSFYFTALFKHVRCEECGTKYNGKTGKSNLVPALMCVSIALLLILGLAVLILWILSTRGYHFFIF
jgi:DNA-directed RNA polymerase subunit RPC12/RpoP